MKESGSFKNILSRISKDDFYNYYIIENHTSEETKNHFHLYADTYTQICNYYNIHKNFRIENLIVKVPQEDLVHYYIKENHTVEECCNHFYISNNQLYKLFNYYNIKKQGNNLITALYNINREDLIHYYIDENHSRQDTLKYFNITINTFKQLCKKYNISFHDKYDIPKEKLYDYYILKNHTSQECVDYFHISSNLFNRLLKKYSIKKEQSLINESTQRKCYEKYGVPYHCMTKECRTSNGKTESKVNKEFAFLLDNHNINYEQEFILEHSSFDFKINNKLIELNPSVTHNVNWNPFGPKSTIDKNYHINKSKLAQKYGYQCVCIWDWDNKEKIINNILNSSTKIGARKCVVKEVDIEEANSFINKYHLQNNIKSQIRIGLYYNNDLVSIMTFGEPRYNKNYEWELLRYCSNCIIIGGAEKIFNYFVIKYNPNSILSYCDFSKFNGDVYNKLGFKKLRFNSPSLHWYNTKTGKHITNNLLNQRGFDQLFGREYGEFGKGTSNKELMLQHGFIQIYDCGQITYVWEKK